jgi:hypothetical protein
MTTAKPTLYAQRGLEFVAIFQTKFIPFDVSGHRPVLRDPPGHSTVGGKLATQHIVLTPLDTTKTAWTVGSVNVATESAKVRSYACMRALALQRARFRSRPFPLDEHQYQRFFDAAVAFMKERGMAVEIESSLPELGVPVAGESDAAEAEPARARSLLVLALGMVALGVAAGVAFLVLRRFLPF